MRQPQLTWIIRLGAIAFVLVALIPPWVERIDLPHVHAQRSAGYRPIVSPPAPAGSNRGGLSSEFEQAAGECLTAVKQAQRNGVFSRHDEDAVIRHLADAGRHEQTKADGEVYFLLRRYVGSLLSGSDVDAARRAGYTDDEIIQYLGSARQMDVDGGGAAPESGVTLDFSKGQPIQAKQPKAESQPPTRVQLPDGNIGEFPAGMSVQQIEAVLQKQYPRKAQSKPQERLMPSQGQGRPPIDLKGMLANSDFQELPEAEKRKFVEKYVPEFRALPKSEQEKFLSTYVYKAVVPTISPDGQVGDIPADRVQDAVKRGFLCNPVAEARKRWPGLKDWSDDRILDNMADPAKFRSAFPEFAALSDDRIRSSIEKLRSGNPAQTAPNAPALPGIDKFIENQKAGIKAAQTQQMPPTTASAREHGNDLFELENRLRDAPSDILFADPRATVHIDWQRLFLEWATLAGIVGMALTWSSSSSKRLFGGEDKPDLAQVEESAPPLTPEERQRVWERVRQLQTDYASMSVEDWEDVRRALKAIQEFERKAKEGRK